MSSTFATARRVTLNCICKTSTHVTTTRINTIINGSDCGKRSLHMIARRSGRTIGTSGRTRTRTRTRLCGTRAWSPPIMQLYNNWYSNSSIKRRRQMSSSTPIHDHNHHHDPENENIHRLHHIRNVGVFAHVDAGKTTVTERMLALAGIVHEAGGVDTGDTVTDFLPAERERGITIQSAAISFPWKWHNRSHATDAQYNHVDNDEVTIHLIDTPGHVDFSVEVNRSVSVLDGAVLVVDSVAGVQAQTETVWRAMTKTTCSTKTFNNHERTSIKGPTNSASGPQHGHHEPLPCIAMVNKMDKEGCDFGYAISTLKYKLPGANPIAIQIPLFRVGSMGDDTGDLCGNIIAIPATEKMTTHGHFVGVVDLIEMHAIIWPDVDSSLVGNVEDCVPSIHKLMDSSTKQPIDPDSNVTDAAVLARSELVSALADHDESMEEYFLMEEDPSNEEIRSALRRATLARNVLPVVTGAALRGKGVEPLLDAVADLLPSPMDRQAPALIEQDDGQWPKKGSSSRSSSRGKKKSNSITTSSTTDEKKIQLGHPLHPSLLALAFKVVHMKNRGGSGDGRVVFARVYSGQLSSQDILKVISPKIPGESATTKPRVERIGGMLELAGGRFNNLKDAVIKSGDVCALIGLKSVVTGDTLLLSNQGNSSSSKKKGKQKRKKDDDIFDLNVKNVSLAGVTSPKPVLTVRIEAESSEQQVKLTNALALLVVEDPSLKVEETESATLLSGLGELHIEVIVDRLRREHGLNVWIGKPAVEYRETVSDVIETSGLMNYDRTIGTTRMQASVHLRMEPLISLDDIPSDTSCCMISDPIITIGEEVREYLDLDSESPESDLVLQSDIISALVSGCLGAMKRGPNSSYALANVRCHIIDIDAEGGAAALHAMPGAIQAASSSILSSILSEQKENCSVLEPTMSVEITAPTDMVGSILSDITSRRGTVGDVVMGDNLEIQNSLQSKALIHGEVPLVEILGYASALRSLTGGEGAFSAEYKGHSTCDHVR